MTNDKRQMTLMIAEMPSSCWSFVTLALMLLALGAVISTVVLFTLVFMLLRPTRMTDGKAVWVLRRLSPGDLGLRYENVTFDIPDEQTGRPLRIAAWWIRRPEGGGRCVVLLHGFADAKVGAIAWAPLWHSLGFSVLAIDLRAHGESGGRNCTAGYWERHDVSQVIDQIRAARPGETAQLVLFGVNLGAAVAAATAALRGDLAAVVLESPPADFQSAARSHMDRLGAPGRLFQSLALSIARQLGHCDFSAVRPVDLVKQIPCPLMIIAPDNDPMVKPADREALEQALKARDREREDVYWRVECGNSLAMAAEPQAYEQHLRDFLHIEATSLP